MTFRRFVASALIAASATTFASADEGMWLLNDPPTQAVQEAFNYRLTPEWLERVQRAAVRFQTGGSASFVSRDGLVMTNHHVGSDMLLKLSTDQRDLIKEGFLAKSIADELPCPDLELNVLWTIRDVTAIVNEGTQGLPADEAMTRRRSAIARLEAEEGKSTGMKCEVVTLFQGATYHLYQYKKYTDVRLVFAPEEAAANFGGDIDNFEFPRYCLDMCFFRVYENNVPIVSEQALKWSRAGASEGELVFAVGHPGRTRRLYTPEHLAFLRDVELPGRLAYLWRSEIKLQGFSGRSAQHERWANEALGGVANGRKALTGVLDGLMNPAILQRKQDDDAALRAFVESDPSRKAKWGDAWKAIAEAQQVHENIYRERYVLEVLPERMGEVLYAARHIARMGNELAKPTGTRLREYNEGALDQVMFRVSNSPANEIELEVELLTQWLTLWGEWLGADDPELQKALAGKLPADRARELVTGSMLLDTAKRAALVEGGASALSACQDPLVRVMREIDARARAVRATYDNQVEAVERGAYAKIAASRWESGAKTYPDATFTLRLSYGVVKGFDHLGQQVPAFTNVQGLFERASLREGHPQFHLAQSWSSAREKLDPQTPFNFVATLDIIGGNSGSPVINRRGEVVGLIFDGNIHSLSGDIAYEPARNRAVAVDARIIEASLRHVYGANALADELTQGVSPVPASVRGPVSPMKAP